MTRLRQLALVVIAGGALLVGGWAQGFPRSFYDDFIRRYEELDRRYLFTASFDRAYVMADPSMDRQEFYVAASRTREETFFYATPEVQFDREEVAPRSPHSRQGLEHIAASESAVGHGTSVRRSHSSPQAPVLTGNT